MKFTTIFSVGVALCGAHVQAQDSLQALYFSLAEVYPLADDSKQLDKRCTGTCSGCFGPGYISCPGSSILCYKPGDPTYGVASCSSSTTSCASQYGLTYRPCPNGARYCYDSNSASGSNACPGGSITSDTCTGLSTCRTCFGSNYIDCPSPDTRSCYDPGNSTSCCPSTCRSGSAAPLPGAPTRSTTRTTIRTTTDLGAATTTRRTTSSLPGVLTTSTTAQLTTPVTALGTPTISSVAGGGATGGGATGGSSVSTPLAVLQGGSLLAVLGLVALGHVLL